MRRCRFPHHGSGRVLPIHRTALSASPRDGTFRPPSPYIPCQLVPAPVLLVDNVDICRLTDDELIFRTKALACIERASSCDLVEHLAEIDRRGLAPHKTGVSLFEFCVYQLRLSEDAAYRRIRAARAIKKFPPISVLFRDGKLSLETISQLHPFLGGPDAAALVKSCIGLRKWQVQALLAGRQPENRKRDVIRYCGPIVPASEAPPSNPASLFEVERSAAPMTPTPEAASVPPPLPPLPQPLPVAPNASIRIHDIRVSFSADAEFHKLLRRAQSLLRHKYPDGRLEGVLKDALAALLKKKDLGFRFRDAARGARRRGGTAAATS
ncbi:MAG: hypothetical protein HY079_01655 [Elusimicrobia bacterium]|nr:hypothetical protein [Elusimicrobiota bacterium]